MISLRIYLFHFPTSCVHTTGGVCNPVQCLICVSLLFCSGLVVIVCALVSDINLFVIKVHWYGNFTYGSPSRFAIGIIYMFAEFVTFFHIFFTCSSRHLDVSLLIRSCGLATHAPLEVWIAIWLNYIGISMGEGYSIFVVYSTHRKRQKFNLLIFVRVVSVPRIRHEISYVVFARYSVYMRLVMFLGCLENQYEVSYVALRPRRFESNFVHTAYSGRRLNLLPHELTSVESCSGKFKFESDFNCMVTGIVQQLSLVAFQNCSSVLYVIHVVPNYLHRLRDELLNF